MRNLLNIKFCSNTNRIYGLDILRAFAILSVVVVHGKHLMPNHIHKWVDFFMIDGVSIFFVLSGFLIGGILLKQFHTNKLSLKVLINFWIRRWFRTLPNYFFILIILLCLSLIFINGFNVFDYERYFIFSQNLFSDHPIFFPEAWSLSIEEWFYLLIPTIIFILAKTIKFSVNQSVLVSALGIILCVTFFRYYRYSNLTIDSLTILDETLRKQVFTRLDSLMYGIIGAYIFYYYHDFWNKYKTYFLITGVILFLGIKLNFLGYDKLGLFNCVFSFSMISIATLFLLPFLSSIKNGKGYLYRGLTTVSLISYSMYLIHLTLVQKWILNNLEWSSIQNFNESFFLISRYILYWLLTILISILMYKYFEVPTMQLRDKMKMK